jgi:hypothetical protein
MDWGRFLDVHFRPHLVVVNIGSPSDSASGRNLIHQLERLTESLATVANYAMYSDDQVIKVAFERDLDADTFSEALVAHAIESSPDWASVSVCSFDFEAQRRMAALLKERGHRRGRGAKQV